jgi:hypothetical protein
MILAVKTNKGSTRIWWITHMTLPQNMQKALSYILMRRVLPSGMWDRVVWKRHTAILDEHAAFIKISVY